MTVSLRNVITALLDCLSDKDEEVLDTASSSLRTLGLHQPDLFVRSVQNFLSNGSKYSVRHRQLIFTILHFVCSEKTDSIPPDSVDMVIALVTHELTTVKEVTPDTKIPASDVLISLCRKHCPAVMEAILRTFQPGAQIHPAVIYALGDVAVTNRGVQDNEFASYLPETLSRALPLMGSLKSDSLKLCFVIAIGKCGESLLENLTGESPMDQSTSDAADQQFTAIYELIMQSWMSGKDVKLRCAIGWTFGVLAHFLTPDKLKEDITKLIRYDLLLYTKTGDHLPLTQGICQLLHACVVKGVAMSEMLMDELWSTITLHVSFEYEVKNVPVMKNQNEILRIFSLSAKLQEDRLYHFLSQRLLNANEKNRCEALHILKHLVNSKSFSRQKGGQIFGSLKPFMAGEPSVKVKRCVGLLAVALLDSDLMETVENGQRLIPFMVRQLLVEEDFGLQTKRADGGRPSVAPAGLSTHFAQSIYYLVSNVPRTHALFWPSLFEYLCDERYTEALADICKNLVIIAQRLKSTEHMLIVYNEENDRLPRPYQIFTRLFVCLNLPCRQQMELCRQAKQLLVEMALLFHPNLTTGWTAPLAALEVPKDAKAVQHEDAWRKNLISLLSCTLDRVDNDDWVMSIAGAFGSQLSLYTSNPEAKRFCFNCYGLTLSKVKSQQYVVDNLELIFRSVAFASEVERKGCAEAVGYCARGHVDIVLTKLENVAKREHLKKSTGLLGFLREALPMKTEQELSAICLRATVLLCYGYVACNCPVAVLAAKLENVIMRYLIMHFDNPQVAQAQEEVVQQSLIITVRLIATAVHPDRVTYEFPFRETLFSYITEYVQPERPDSASTDLRLQAVRAVLELTKLDPLLDTCAVWSLGTMFANCIYPLEQVRDQSLGQEMVENCLSTFNSWLLEVMRKDMKVETLMLLIKVLQGWLSSSKAIHRQRAISSASLLLEQYYVNTEVVLGRATPIPVLGNMLARFAPRTCDPDQLVRWTALKCLYWLMEIASLHRGHGRNYSDSAVELLSSKCEELESSNSEVHFRILQYICYVIDQRLPAYNKQQYISVLVDMIFSEEEEALSCASAVLLKSILSARGPQLTLEAEKLIYTLIDKMNTYNLPLRTYAETLQAFFEFSRHHIGIAVQCLLSQQIPLQQVVCDCWRALARDSSIFAVLMQQLLEMASEEDLYDVGEHGQPKVAKFVPLAAVAALREVIQGVDSTDLLTGYYGQAYVTLIIQCGTLVDCRLPSGALLSTDFIRQHGPCSLLVAALRALLMRCRYDDVLFAVAGSNSWKDFEDAAHFPDALSEMSNAVARYCPEMVSAIVEKLKKFSSSANDSSRVVVMSTYAGLMKHCTAQEESLVEEVVNGLLSGLVDPHLVVRKFCVRGLGNVVHASDAVFDRYSSSALAAMTAGLEDSCDFKDEVAFEAMQGLSKLTSRVSVEQIERILVDVALRIRPCFEKESAATRSVAFFLLGNLCRFGKEQNFVDQLHHCLVPLLLHINDECEQVRAGAHFSLVEAFKLIKEDALEVISNMAIPPGTCLDYAAFLKQITNILVTFTVWLDVYAMYGSNYCKSPSVRIRCNAALFIGYLLGATPQDLRKNVSKELIFSGLLVLLKEPEAEVRQAAARSLGHLYNY